LDNGANNISPNDLVSEENPICLGEGSYGKCYLKMYQRIGIYVVENQMPNVHLHSLLREVQIMQTLAHPNIPTVLGIQIKIEPFSIVMQFIGEANVSLTIHKLLQSEHKLQRKDWLKISYNISDALQYMHKQGYLHCDLKSNNIVVSNDHKGFLIDFGKASPVSSPPSKKYISFYPYIAPEVLSGSPCSMKSDIYSLGIVLSQIGLSQNIDGISDIAKICTSKNSSHRPTLVRILASLSAKISN